MNTWPSQLSHRLSLNLALREAIGSSNSITVLDLSYLSSRIFSLLHRRIHLFFPRLSYILRVISRRNNDSFYLSSRKVNSACVTYNCKIELRRVFPTIRLGKPSIDSASLESLIQNLWLDARGKDLISESPIKVWYIKWEIWRLSHQLKKISEVIKDFDLIYLYNGRFPVDFLLGKLLSTPYKVRYFESGMRQQTLATYEVSTHSFAEHKSKAMRLWEEAEGSVRRNQAIDYLKQRQSYKSESFRYWNRFQNPYSLRELPSNRRLVSFFFQRKES